MKISLVINLICAFAVTANTFSQSESLSINTEKSSVKDIFRIIEDQSSYRFFYNDELSDIDRIVNLSVENTKVEDILDKLFANSGVSYTVLENKLIVIAPKRSLQQQRVTGTVTDGSNGEPIPGVYIRILGTNAGGVTDADGKYTIELSNPDVTLQFSFIGFVTEEIQVSGRSVIDVAMTPEITSLEEVVVTGYSVEKKKDIIGSVAVVNTEELLQTNSPSVSGQLQGRAAGVFVSSDGEPDGVSKVRIRGFGSFDESDPLYIIDGVPAEASTFNNLNPSDVQSIQVLKDAASASVYGARAASGVVIITTKTGKVGKAKVSVDMYTGMNYVSEKNFPELLNAQEYGEYWWLANIGAGFSYDHQQYGNGSAPVIPEYLKAGGYDGAELEGFKTTNPTLFAEAVNPDNYDFETYQIVKSGDTDWFDEVFNPASISNVQLSVSGGSDVGTYSVSMNYFTQDNTSNKYAYYERYTTRANSSFNIGKSIKLGENLQVSYINSSGTGGAGTAWSMQPILPVYDIMGNPTGGSVTQMGQQRNPITSAWRDRFDKTNNFGVFGNVFADITFLKDFVFRTSFGIDYSNGNIWNLTQQTYENAENTSISSLSRNMVWGTSWTWTNTLTYNKVFGMHTVKVLLGSEAIRNYSDNIIASRSGYDIIDDSDFLTLDSGLGTRDNEGAFTRQSLASLFGRVDYSFADKYLINATVRRDGSSKFGKNNRYGVFPAFGIGWRISEESFMPEITWLDDLKLRASYGIIGNQTGLKPQNQYTMYTKAPAGGYAIGGSNNVIPGYYTTNIGNPDAKWEKSITSNIGFDASILRNKLTVSFEYFTKKTEDLLVQNQAPYTGSNAEQPSINIGDMTNKGIELSIVNRGNIIEGLTYEATANFSLYRNKVDKILDSKDAYLAGAEESGLGVTTRTKAGYPISYIWGYKVDGFFETDQEAADYAAEYSSWITPEKGRWRIKDISGPDGTPDNVVDQYDRVQIGSPHPDFQVGFNLALTYKNFDFSTFIFWNQGGEVFNQSRQNTDFNRWTYNRSKRMLYQSWTEGADNSNALLPKLDIDDTQTVSAASDYFVEDVTYVRMKTLQLGYTLPTNIINKIKLERLRIYVQAQNLFTWVGGDKPFTGLDPDAALTGNATDTRSSDITMGMVGNQNPTPKQFVVGLNMTF